MAEKLYTASMTGCGFMHSKMTAMLPLILNPDADALIKQEVTENNILLIKSVSSRKRAVVECREYYNRLHVVADHQIAFDLEDSVVENYAKFGVILSKIK